MERGKDVNVSVATRLALLELLVIGSVPKGTSILGLTQSAEEDSNNSSVLKKAKIAPYQSITQRSQEANIRFTQSIEQHKPIVQFVEDYRANRQYLLPQANTHTATQSNDTKTEHQNEIGSENITPQSTISLLLDSEEDLRQLDRDLHSCDNFAQRQVAGAGNLSVHEALLPTLNVVKESVARKLTADEELEREALDLMERYRSHVRILKAISTTLFLSSCIANQKTQIGFFHNRSTPSLKYLFIGTQCSRVLKTH